MDRAAQHQVPTDNIKVLRQTEEERFIDADRASGPNRQDTEVAENERVATLPSLHSVTAPISAPSSFIADGEPMKDEQALEREIAVPSNDSTQANMPMKMSPLSMGRRKKRAKLKLNSMKAKARVKGIYMNPFSMTSPKPLRLDTLVGMKSQTESIATIMRGKKRETRDFNF